MSGIDSAAFYRGFNKGWDAAKFLEWTPLHELEENADISRRAGDAENCGYWCGRKSGQECANKQSNQPYQADSAGMLISYE